MIARVFGAGVILFKSLSQKAFVWSSEGRSRLALIVFDERIRVVVVDGFKVLSFHSVPYDGLFAVGPQCDVSNEVFDEDRIVVRPLGNGFLVWALEDAVELTRGRFFDELDEIFDPDGIGESNGVSDLSTLVVGASVTNGFGAGAESCDGHDDGDHEVRLTAFEGRVKTDRVVEKSNFAGDWSGFF